jgi:hypothetical protein
LHPGRGNLYEVPVFAFNATDELFTCCLGFADDD